MKSMIFAAIIVAIPFTAIAHKKFDQKCSEIALIMGGHAMRLSSITTQVVLELHKLSPKDRAVALKAARAVDGIGGMLFDELSLLTLSLVLRNNKFTVLSFLHIKKLTTPMVLNGISVIL